MIMIRFTTMDLMITMVNVTVTADSNKINLLTMTQSTMMSVNEYSNNNDNKIDNN